MASKGGDFLAEKAKEEAQREEYKVTCNCDGCPKKPMGSITGINFLEAPDLSEGEEQMLQGRLLLEFEEMLFAFQRAVSAAWRSINRRKLSPQVFVDCLMSVKALAPDHGGPDLSLFHGREEIVNATRIEEVFFAIHEHMSFFNYHLIEHIVDSIGAEPDRSELEKYKDRYESFCRRRVFETQALISPPSRKHRVCLRVKVNVDNTFSLKHLEGFQTRFASILKLSRFSLHLIYIEKFGSLQVTFQMPIFLRELVFPLSDEQKRELQRADVVLVLLCDTCQYSAEDLPPAMSVSDSTDKCLQAETSAAEAMAITTAADYQSPTKGQKASLLSPPKSERDYSLKFSPSRALDMVHQELARSGIDGENYLLFAPSDADKAIVAALVTSSHLQKKAGKGRVAFIVNATSSAQEHAGELQSLITQSQISLCTDVGSSESISSLLTNTDIAVCTVENFLDSLARNLIRFSDITLMLVDNFQHIHGTTPLAQVMHSYLEHKRQNGGSTIPQVVGLATLPAAADAYKPELENTMRQLLSVCALMDATSGVKTNTLSIPESSTRPLFTFEITNRRDQNEPFIVCVCSEMSKLEQMVDLRCPFTKWSSEYDALLCQKIDFLAASSNTEDQNQVSILELLQCYSRALSIYMDARYEDALSVLIVHCFTDPTSHLQEQLAQGLEEVKNELSQIPLLDNPLMLRLEEILLEQFLEKPRLRGLLVVHTQQQVSCIHDWLLSLPTISELHIRPSILSFREDVEADIPRVMNEFQTFKEGKFNLLITTSEIEEIINLPPCNIIIRLQSLSTELALKLQKDGSSHTSDAIGFTILSSPTRRIHQDIKIDEVQSVIKEALKCLPIGRQFRQQVLQKQKKMVRVHALRKQRASSGNKKRRATTTTEMLQLKCKSCTTLMVKGTDIYTIEEGTQCVAPEDEFREMIVLKPRLPSRRMLGRLNETHKIYCRNCNTELGSLCYWPAKECDLPVLRCKSFRFEVNGIPHTVRKWSEVPLHIPPLSTHPNYPNNSCSDSGTVSDIECSD